MGYNFTAWPFWIIWNTSLGDWPFISPQCHGCLWAHLSQNPESYSREAWAADWCPWIWQKYLLSAHVHSHPSSLMVRQILKPNVFLVEPRVREHRCISKMKVPVPCDHRVRRSRGDTCEGDWLLVVCCSVEGLLEHRQHWRDCRHKQEGEESTWELDS